MPIDDILNEKTGYREQQVQPQQQQQSTTPSATISNGTITLEIPDPTTGTHESMVFWMNVAQTALLLYIAWQLG